MPSEGEREQGSGTSPETEKTVRSGGCLCGKLRYKAAGPLRVHYCHCSMCRRATGSAFAVLAWLPRENLSWDGGSPAIYRSSPIATRGFCPSCGSALTLEYAGAPEIALHVGTLDDAASVAPQYHYGSESQLEWADCGQDLHRHRTKETW